MVILGLSVYCETNKTVTIHQRDCNYDRGCECTKYEPPISIGEKGLATCTVCQCEVNSCNPKYLFD